MTERIVRYNRPDPPADVPVKGMQGWVWDQKNNPPRITSLCAFNIDARWDWGGWGCTTMQCREDGTWYFDLENMGRESIRQIMHAAVDAAVDAIPASEFRSEQK